MFDSGNVLPGWKWLPSKTLWHELFVARSYSHLLEDKQRSDPMYLKAGGVFASNTQETLDSGAADQRSTETSM